MANEIKLKRGSGSDPTSSDLVVGEIAIRTDSGKLFTKKDNGTVAEISGSGGIDDGDKGDITVSNGGDTFTIDSGVVTSAKIADGTIVNADISSLANIDGSKIQAAGIINQGAMTAAQHNKLAGIEDNATADMTATEVLSLISGDNIILGEIASTGNSTFAGNLTVSSSDGGSSAAPEIDIYRNSASPADADYLGQIKFSGESDDGSKEVYAKITGKIGDASSGTEDGILEIAHTKAGSNNISARFTSTDLKLINGTGLEVAGNISCDGTIDGRDVASDGTKLDGIESGATADQTAAEIRTLVGNASDSNVFTDALLSKLNGIAASATNVTNNNQLTNGAGYITATLTNEQVQDIVGGMLSGNTESGITVTYQDGDGTIDFAVASQTDNNFTNADHSKLDGIEAGATADQSASEIKTAYESNSDTNAFTDALLSKLNGIAASATNVTNNNQLTNGAGYITATLTNEQVQDIVGGMVSGNTESGISVTYQDGDGTLDFAVTSQTDENFTTTLKNKLDGIAAGATNVTNTNQLTNGAGFITATLTNEQVQDIVGAMVSGNTESGITVTYQDGDGTLDFSVASQTDNNFTDADHSKLDGIASGATNVTNNNQISNGAGYVTSSVINSLNASNLSSGTIPDARFPSTLPAVDGSNLTGISAGATGGGSDEVFYENDQTVTTNYTITNGKNAMAAGPITINSGVTVTVGSGETLTIV